MNPYPALAAAVSLAVAWPAVWVAAGWLTRLVPERNGETEMPEDIPDAYELADRIYEVVPEFPHGDHVRELLLSCRRRMLEDDKTIDRLERRIEVAKAALEVEDDSILWPKETRP